MSNVLNSFSDLRHRLRDTEIRALSASLLAVTRKTVLVSTSIDHGPSLILVISPSMAGAGTRVDLETFAWACSPSESESSDEIAGWCTRAGIRAGSRGGAADGFRV